MSEQDGTFQPPTPSGDQPVPPPPPPVGSQAPAGYGAPQQSFGSPGLSGPVPSAPMPAEAHTGLVNIAGLGTAKVATLGQRALARIVDSVIYAAVWGLLTAIGVGAIVGTTTTDEMGREIPSGGGLGAFLLLMALGSLFTVAYELVMIGTKGATLGKMVMGVKVVDQRNGKNPGMGQSFMRILIPTLANFLCGLGLLVFLSPIFDRSGRMQGWHDSAANDLVISTK